MPIPSEEGAAMVSEWIIRQVSLKTGQTNRQAREPLAVFTLTLFGHPRLFGCIRTNGTEPAQRVYYRVPSYAKKI